MENVEIFKVKLLFLIFDYFVYNLKVLYIKNNNFNLFYFIFNWV